LMIDIWIISNIIYYRASGFFINIDALQMVDNMQGFWDSILIYFSWGEVVPLFTTLFYILFVIKFNKPEINRRWLFFFFTIFLCICMRIFINYFQHALIVKDYWIRKEKTNVESVWNTIRPIIDPQYDAYYAARLYFNHGILDWDKKYILQNTIVDYLFADLSFLCTKNIIQTD
jgi:hypothetical protein